MVRKTSLKKATGLFLGLAAGVGCLAAEAQEPQRNMRRTNPPQVARRAATPSPAPTPTPAPVAEVELEAAPTTLPDNVELIQERFANGNVRIQHYVTQDAEGSFINHGPWVEYNQAGKKIGQGEFRYGKRHGKWTRYFAQGEGAMFSGPLYKQYQAPFISVVNLVDGELQGTWTIYDSRQLKCSEWEFEDGQRHGKSIWYYPSGQRAREVDYRQGEIDGKVLAWNTNDQLTQDDTFYEGRKHANKVLWHSPGKKRAEGWILHAKEPAETEFDWWNGTIVVAPDQNVGVDERHGMWTWWFPNGQKYSEGRYLEDQPVGKWTFWHSNGLKHMEGEYLAGVQSGKWSTWQENGQIVRIEEHAGDAELSTGGEASAENSLEIDDFSEGDEVEQDDAPEMGRLRVPNFE
jgi:antitoxin component YwqK of YwqJK toxin-antitoxin module